MEAESHPQSILAHLRPDTISSLNPIVWDRTLARAANYVLVAGALLLAASLPHSIAAADISLGICLLGWILRDLSLKKFHCRRTGFELPILFFSVWTIASAALSVEPGLSLPKLRSLLLFILIYLVAGNFNERGAKLILVVLLASGLTGALFSLGEKLIGRGVVISRIDDSSPLRGTGVETGDVIWLINKKRVGSLEEINAEIKKLGAGRTAEIEALHNGDPIPVQVRIEEGMRTDTNPIGIVAGGKSRQFRASGFSRHFLTFAEQMQLFALFVIGAALWSLRRKGPSAWLSPPLAALMFAVFSISLGLTATRAVIASFLLTTFMIAVAAAPNRKVASGMALLVMLVALLAGLAVIKTRDDSMARFSDDSTSRRIGYMKAGLRVIPFHPVFGVGMDSHKNHWEDWGFPGTYVTHTHSTPIQIAMERGVPALIFYLWLFASLAISFYKRYLKEAGWYDLGALACVTGFFLSSLTNYNFGDSESLMLFFFLLSISLALRDKTNTQAS